MHVRRRLTARRGRIAGSGPWLVLDDVVVEVEETQLPEVAPVGSPEDRLDAPVRVMGRPPRPATTVWTVHPGVTQLPARCPRTATRRHPAGTPSRPRPHAGHRRGALPHLLDRKRSEGGDPHRPHTGTGPPPLVDGVADGPEHRTEWPPRSSRRRRCGRSCADRRWVARRPPSNSVGQLGDPGPGHRAGGGGRGTLTSSNASGPTMAPIDTGSAGSRNWWGEIGREVGVDPGLVGYVDLAPRHG